MADAGTCKVGATPVPFIHNNNNAHRILIGKPEGNRPLGRLRSRWEDNIKMDFREIVWEAVGWIHLTQDTDRWHTIVNTLIYLRVL
jgi:hypothetical protein